MLSWYSSYTFFTREIDHGLAILTRKRKRKRKDFAEVIKIEIFKKENKEKKSHKASNVIPNILSQGATSVLPIKRGLKKIKAQ